MTLTVRILQSLTRLFIILVSLTMSLFSEKMLIFNRWISGLMSNLIKKSWTVSNMYTTCSWHVLSLKFSCTLDSGINVGVRLLIFGLFSRGYVLIKGGTFINFFNFLSFKYFFFTFFPSAMYKKIKLFVILRGGYAYSRGYVYCFCQLFQGLRLFQGVRLFRSLEYWTCNSMNNLWSYCGLVDAKISASEKDLPVQLSTRRSGILRLPSRNLMERYQRESFCKHHTVILPDWTLKKWALSSFAFQSY